MKQKRWIKIMAILLLLLIVGCAAQVQTATKSSLVSTSMLIITKNPSEAAFTDSPTSSSQPPTLTVTSTVQLSTATYQPTLPAEEAKALVFDLLQNNGGCRLPCLWGLTPGETGVDILNNFMARFGELTTTDVYIRVQDFDDVGGFFLSYRENYVHKVVDLSYYKNKESHELDLLTLRGYAMQERGKDLDWLSPDVSPLYGDASFNQAFQYYLLPQILSNYGPPSQVLLAPFPDDPDRPDVKWRPFSLVLFYPDQGIFVEYVSPREKRGIDFVGCPSKAQISLAVWSPESDLTLEDIVQKAGSGINELNMDYFKPVEEATSMTLDEFYQKFKDPENTACLETPMEVWP